MERKKKKKLLNKLEGMLENFEELYVMIKKQHTRGEDGGTVRRGGHLPPHRYIRNTSTRGTAPIEHPLNTGRRPQTSQKARNSPRTWVG